MSISGNDVLNALFVIAPSFYTTDPTVLDEYNAMIALVQCQVNPQILACCGVMVFAFLVAHYLTLSQNGTLGTITSLHEGQLSIAYNVKPDIKFLDLTPYGRAYQDLVRRTVVGSTVTNLPPVLGGIFQIPPTNCGCNGFGGFGWGGGWGFGNAGM